jgi:beta-amylase
MPQTTTACTPVTTEESISGEKGSFAARSVEGQQSGGSLRTCSVMETLENQPPVIRNDECLSPALIDSILIAERDSRNG